MLLIIRGNVYKKVYNGTVMNNLMNKMLAVNQDQSIDEDAYGKIYLWQATVFCIALFSLCDGLYCVQQQCTHFDST